MSSTPLPPDDPAFPAVSKVLIDHHGVTLAPGDTHNRLLSALLDVIIDDRAGQMTADLEVTTDSALQLGDDPDEAEPLGTVLVQSGVSPTGAYTCEINYNDDVSTVLSPGEIGPYADNLLAAAVLAVHSAAILRQLTTQFGMALDLAQSVIIDLRKNLPGIDQKATRPLIVRPSVGHRTGRPYVHLRLAGTQQKWAWELASVWDHVLAVKRVAIVADLDSAYRRLLVGEYGVEDRQARAIVGTLGNWLHEG